MLPSEPKIFHGRETEITAVLTAFSDQAPRVAILGAGGMGKTSIARAVLHHTDITAKFGHHRFFITCDPATNKVELAALIGTYLGLKPGRDLGRVVIQHFSTSPPALLILDNLETAWEPTESRKEVEEFLSLLTDINHLALMVTIDLLALTLTVHNLVRLPCAEQNDQLKCNGPGHLFRPYSL